MPSIVPDSMSAAQAETVHVAVAVIINDNREVCISRRHPQAHQGGLWEFPGGKIENGESVEQALAREIAEEIGLRIIASRPLIRIEHAYADKTVCLHVHRVERFSGTARGREGQPVKWLALSELVFYDFPQANYAIIKAMSLPDKYLITGKFADLDDFQQKLEKALSSGIRLVQLRLKKDSLSEPALVQAFVETSAALCKQAGAKLLLNIAAELDPCLDLSGIDFAGYHADSSKLKSLSERPPGELFCASCHNTEELQKAMDLKADFMVLSPVLPTASHPDMPALGWEAFAKMIRDIPVPVYALGGVSEKDLETALENGAQGVAAISAFWK